MTKADIKTMLAAELGAGVSDGQLEQWVESGRKMVARATYVDNFGRTVQHLWRGLLTYNTLTTVANDSDYLLPDEFNTDPKLDIGHLMNVKGQDDTDRPIKIYPIEVANEKDFTAEEQAIIIINHPNQGQMTIRFKDTPASAATYDVWYRRKVPNDSLDFVPDECHDIFYWAALIFAYKKAITPMEQGGFNNAVTMYKEALAGAIASDFYATQEYGQMLPDDSVIAFQDTVLIFQAERE